MPPIDRPEPLTDADILELDRLSQTCGCRHWRIREFEPWIVEDSRGRIIFRAEGPGADRDAAFAVDCGRKIAGILDLVHGIKGPRE